MARLLAAAGGFAAALVSCGDPATIALGLPPGADDPGLRSLFIAVTSPSEPRPRVIASVLGSGMGAIRLAPGRDAVIEALAYRATLQEIGLGPGELAAVEGGEPLPRADLNFRVDVAEGEMSGSWREQREPSEPLRVLPLVPARTSSACPAFDVERIELPEVGPSSMVAPIAPDRVLIGTKHAAYLATPERLDPVEVRPAHLELTVGLMEADGALLFGVSNDPRLLRGRLEGGALEIDPQPVATSSSGQPIAFLAGVSGPGVTEVFALTNGGAIERFDGRSFTLLHQFPRQGTATSRKGGIARTRLGAAVFGSVGATYAVRYEDGLISVEPEGLEGAGGIVGVAVIPALGVLVGAARGPVFRSELSRWVPLPGTEAVDARVMAPFQDGFVGVTAGTAELVHWRPGIGRCGESVNLGGITTGLMAPLGAGWIMAGDDNEATMKTPVVRVVPRPR